MKTTIPKLYPRGTLAADVPADFRGMPWERWMTLQLFSGERPTAADEPPKQVELPKQKNGRLFE